MVMGGDHGNGAFLCGVMIIISTATKSFDFEIFAAEVICGKDDAEVIKKSILTELTTGLQLIEDNEFVLTKNLLEGSIAPLVLL